MGFQIDALKSLSYWLKRHRAIISFKILGLFQPLNILNVIHINPFLAFATTKICSIWIISNRMSIQED